MHKMFPVCGLVIVLSVWMWWGECLKKMDQIMVKYIEIKLRFEYYMYSKNITKSKGKVKTLLFFKKYAVIFIKICWSVEHVCTWIKWIKEWWNKLKSLYKFEYL